MSTFFLEYPSELVTSGWLAHVFAHERFVAGAMGSYENLFDTVHRSTGCLPDSSGSAAYDRLASAGKRLDLAKRAHLRSNGFMFSNQPIYPGALRAGV
jgi:hypothetical protein